MRRFFNQLIETLESRLFSLHADDPPVHDFSVTRRLGLEKLPRCLISFELSQIRLDQFRTSLFVRIDAGSIFFTSFISSYPGRLHSNLCEQSLYITDVHRAPNASGLARSKTNLVALIIDVLANAVDPT